VRFRKLALFVLISTISTLGQAPLMPTLEGKTLSGKDIVLPSDAHQPLILYVVAFNSDYNRQSSDWVGEIAAARPMGGRLISYQILTIGSVPGFVQPMIRFGMKMRIPSKQHSTFVLLFDDKQQEQLRDLSKNNDLLVVLATNDGNIVWQDHGRFDQKKLALLEDAIQGESVKSSQWSHIAAASDAEVKSFFDQTGVPGISYGLVYRDHFVTKGYGVRDVSTRDKVTSRTLFHLASVSKPFVAVAVMRLMESGRLRLDDPVTDYLPYFSVTGAPSSEITLQQLLAHTSGLPDVESYDWQHPQFDAGALERYVRSIAGVKLISEPGVQTNYSNMGYEVLGDVIAKASRKTFELCMRESILDPLGMQESTFLLPDVPKEMLAQPYMIDAGGHATLQTPFPYTRSHAPSSTLYSNADEMVLWLQLHLHDGKADHSQLVTDKSMKMMLAPVVPRSVQTTQPVVAFQGLGWSGLVIDGVTVYGHGGHDNGFRAIVLFVPSAQAGVVLMTNGDGPKVNLDGLAIKLTGILLGRDWSQIAQDAASGNDGH